MSVIIDQKLQQLLRAHLGQSLGDLCGDKPIQHMQDTLIHVTLMPDRYMLSSIQRVSRMRRLQ
jgi:hypothetical protein